MSAGAGIWACERLDREEICAQWGFASPLHALVSLAHADRRPVRTPALDFADKTGYMGARQAWRARQRVLDARIRACRQAQRTPDKEVQAQAQCAAYLWGRMAEAALLERRLQKRQAAAQAAQAAQAAPAP